MGVGRKGHIDMRRSSFGRRAISAVISIMIVFAFMPILGQDAYAAAKKPKAPKITTAQVNGNAVILKWSKVKKAKKYKVYVQTGSDSWKYWKSVRKNKTNKKKYSNKLKYKLKKSGKKYKVYKQTNPYKLIAKTKVRSFTYKGNYGTTYRFVVRAMKGKKAGKYSKTAAVTTPSKPGTQTKPETQAQQNNDPVNPSDPEVDPSTVPPAKVSRVKATAKGNVIKVAWTAVSGANDYQVFYKGPNDSDYKAWTTTTKLSKTSDDKKFQYSTTYSFKVRARNNIGVGEFSNVVTCTTGRDPATLEIGEFSSDPDEAYAQFEAKMLKYYKDELAKRGVSIDSKKKSDDFQKLQAIIQVMHDRVGLSEEISYDDPTRFPTGRTNWYYGNAYNNTGGDYYNGKDYLSTIEFYGSCDTVASIEGYLAEQAGLPLETLIDRGGHVFVIIQANYVWYNADAWFYMYPGCNGINVGGTIDPSTFTESAYDLGLKMSIATTASVTEGFKLQRVFYGTKEAITSDNGLLFGNVIGISADEATYSSSDESIISFDNTSKTYTLHNTGTAYVKIVYKNIKQGKYQSKYPTFTTTIRVKVLN